MAVPGQPGDGQRRLRHDRVVRDRVPDLVVGELVGLDAFGPGYRGFQSLREMVASDGPAGEFQIGVVLLVPRLSDRLVRLVHPGLRRLGFRLLPVAFGFRGLTLGGLPTGLLVGGEFGLEMLGHELAALGRIGRHLDSTVEFLLGIRPAPDQAGQVLGVFRVVSHVLGHTLLESGQERKVLVEPFDLSHCPSPPGQAPSGPGPPLPRPLPRPSASPPPLSPGAPSPCGH